MIIDLGLSSSDARTTRTRFFVFILDCVYLHGLSTPPQGFYVRILPGLNQC